MKLTFRYFFAFIVTLTTLCEGISPSRGGEGPWFTGPLLTPSARVVPPGHFSLEPYLYWTEYNGIYNNDWHVESKPKFYDLTAQLVYKIGLIDRWNIGGSIQGFYGWTQGKSDLAFGDLPIALDYEVYKGKTTYLKFTFQEIFPTGKYEKLSAKKLGTDAGGAGSYVSVVALTIGNLHHFCGDHYLNTRASLAYFMPSKVGIKGLSVYGGDPTTSGTVHPGTAVSLFFGAEYTLTKNWALACDLGGQYSDKISFKGKTILPANSPSSAQFSVAPAIEYNWNESMGVIAGTWFTFAGRNSSKFINAVAAFNYNY